MTKDQLSWEFSLYDLRRLEKYSSLQADYLLVKDLVARLSRIYFVGRLNATLKNTQSVSRVLLIILWNTDVGLMSLMVLAENQTTV